MSHVQSHEHWQDAAFESSLYQQPEEFRRQHGPSEQEPTETLPKPVESVVPAGNKNLGIKRSTRVVIALLIASMGIIGLIAANNLLLGITLAVVSVGGATHLLATAKTQNARRNGSRASNRPFELRS